MSSIRTDKFNATSFQVDKNKKLRLEAIVSFLQENAVRHGTKAGLGYHRFIKENKIWIMNRLSITINRMPIWQEDIYIDTWVKELKRVFLIRDFYIKDSDNKLIGKASGTYTLIDMNTKRPQNLSFITDYMKTVSEKIAYNNIASKVEKLKTINKKETYLTKYSDVDLNGHISNIRYIQWMLDVIPSEIKDNYSIKKLDINYLAELHLNDEICINIEELDKEKIYLCSITLNNSTEDVCRAKFVFKH